MIATIPAGGTTSKVQAAERFFQAARAGFEAAARPAGAERTLLLGQGYRLRLRFGSSALAGVLGAAFAHLPEAPADGQRPDFSIDAWDAASSGIPMPIPPWRSDDYGPYGEIEQQDWPRTLRARFNASAGILSMVDATRRAAIWWTRDVARLADFERAAPFAILLHWWHLLCPVRPGSPAIPVHAAAVGGAEEGGLLLVGRGGSGKSTTALACLAAGFAYVGDDYCLVQNNPAGPWAASLYGTAKLSDTMLPRFPCFAPVVTNPRRAPGEKALLSLGQDFPTQLVPGLPLRAIVLPSVHPGQAETRLVPARPAAGLQALAPSTICLFPRVGDEGAALLSQLAQLTRSLPCFHLQLGGEADPTRTPELLAGLLARLHRETSAPIL